ncbi:DUF1559 domain-containing protein [Aeoliella sp. ICT_H6.2]|uniref:DUF1559 domain-containing protein n=1 Tax=Aeoliella straminimaris TaxID=2954799 RepID=A0A9X2FHT8_9BACT|nr:DUF1559 domain-containing protein [Aeoliella straminimaris]MCO6047179.1 DUF1559 domain-containing protein [Aeoliella straminimaris]
MTFRLVTLLYVFALFSAGLAMFGGWGGCLATAGVLMLWGALRSRELASGCGLSVVACALLASALLIQPVKSAREAARRSSCMGHLKQLSLALLNYNDAQGTLPPAVASLGTSGDTQSWRVLVMPYLESNHIFNAYNFNEPWNGPTNRKFTAGWLFECPTHGIEGATSYLAVVGPQCVWSDGPPRKVADITDDRSQTITLIDVGRSDIDWKEPRDLTFDEAVELLTAPVDPQTFTGHYSEPSMWRKRSYFYNVAMVDTSIHSLRVPLDRSTAEALLTANGGETIGDEVLEKLAQPELRYDRIYGAILFAIVALTPVVPTARRKIWATGEVAGREEQEATEGTDVVLEH